MNLHNIVRGAIRAVNPEIIVTVQRSTGSTTNPDGTRVPTYETIRGVRAQMQALQYNDIAMLDGLNIQGERRSLYLNGNWEGLVRADGKGGDVITFPDGTVWLVAIVLENWAFRDGWVKVAVTRQVN
jgi:hypothetical protein